MSVIYFTKLSKILTFLLFKIFFKILTFCFAANNFKNKIMIDDYLQSEDDENNEEEGEEWNKSLLDNPVPTNGVSTLKRTKSARQIKQQHLRCIVHIDIDCFYAQIEMIKNPELCNVPMGIKQKNLVVTTNYPARNAGVPKSCWIPDALKICPDLVLINGEDLHDYRQYSQRIFELFKSFKVPVEKLGLDENFLDVTSLVTSYNADCNDESVSLNGHCFRSQNETFCQCGCDRRLKLASNIAQKIRTKLFEELSITASAGIAHNKLVSKMIGSRHKPNNQTTIFPCDVTDFLEDVSDVGRLPGIGSVTSKKLQENGLGKISDIITCEKQRIRHLFASEPIVAKKICDFCSGVDDSPVVMSRPAKSIGVEDRFKGIDRRDKCVTHLEWLFDRLCLLIHEDGRMPTVIKISARDFEKAKSANNKFMRETRQAKISPDLFKSLTRDSKLEPMARGKVLKMYLELLGKIVNLSCLFRLTLLGVSVTGFDDQNSGGNKQSISSFFSDRKSVDSLTNNSMSRSIPSQNLLSQPTTNRPNPKKRTLEDGDLPDSSFPSLKTTRSVAKGNKLSTGRETLQGKKNSLFKKFSSTATTRTNFSYIPADWDEDIFKQLPGDVQQELLRHINNAAAEKNDISLVGETSSSSDKTHCSHRFTTCDQVNANTNFNNKTKLTTSKNNNGSRLFPTETGSKNTTNTMSNNSTKYTSSTATGYDNNNDNNTKLHSSSGCWDEEVFQQLPTDLQQELLASQQRTQQLIPKKDFVNRTTNPSSSLSKSKSAVNQPKSKSTGRQANSIFTYFRKT